MKTKNILCEECHGMGFISMVGENSAWSERCNKCNGAGNIEVPITNFDKITENEWTLAKFIIDTVTHCQFNNCEDCPLYEADGCSRQEKVKEWLQKEIDDEEDK